MQQTTKYQFNLIEGGDNFSPDPLNENMEKVEGQFTAMDEALAETASANSMIKLAEASLPAQTASITVSLADYDMSQFQALELYIENIAATQITSINCTANQDQSSLYVNTTANTVNGYLSIGTASLEAYGRCSSICRIADTGQCLTFSYEAFYTSTSSVVYNRSMSGGVYKGCALSGVNSLTFTAGAGSFLAGARFALYGIRR